MTIKLPNVSTQILFLLAQYLKLLNRIPRIKEYLFSNMNRTFREVTDRRPGLEPPQFSLRALFVLIASVACAIGLARWAGPVVSFVGILAILSIVAHVASTAIGGQLRRNGDRSFKEFDTEDNAIRTAVMQPTNTVPADFAPTTQLSHHQPLDRKPIYFGIGTGASLGAILAASILTLVMWKNLSIVNVLFGACSAAVVGSFIGFWASSLYIVARNAWREAERETSNQ